MEIVKFGEILKNNVSKVVLGKEEVIEKIVVCILSKGHVLLEDIPGTGKTTLAKSLAKSLGCQYKRIQFTADLLPSDLTGVNYFNQKTSDFSFQKGAVFTNILLADEINRATPRTQSSLLECMEEKQVSIDTVTYKLEEPFIVIATENPVETQGTFPLPEAQLDRFLMRLSVGYPDETSELKMMSLMPSSSVLGELESVVTTKEVLEAQTKVDQIKLSENVAKYIIDIVKATRVHDKIRLGASPRATLAMAKASKALAALRGRDYVLPDDVKYLAADVLAHRIIIKGYNALNATEQSIKLVNEVVNSVELIKG